MNTIYLSGIASAPIMKSEAPPHLTFTLCVSHKTSLGETRRENYPVSVWRKTALWANAHVRQGRRITLQGYITQSRRHVVTEISAIEIVAREISLLDNPPEHVKDMRKQETAWENPSPLVLAGNPTITDRLIGDIEQGIGDISDQSE